MTWMLPSPEAFITGSAAISPLRPQCYQEMALSCPKVQLTETFLLTILINVSDYSHTKRGSRTDAGGDTTEDPGSNRKTSSDERAGAGDHQGDRAGNRPFRGRALQAL